MKDIKLRIRNFKNECFIMFHYVSLWFIMVYYGSFFFEKKKEMHVKNVRHMWRNVILIRELIFDTKFR
ncbi:hypothetical protein GLOIN_2v1677785 [Rhizophagus irregularis DAOM 181602=DAOM 197198]|uniref:Uncharacterized protein n=1 Tax=Rhizophagus irregularis (strain DAOM 181602 / DAOM 197198 / MUCL 43194) TaxID=747089 RepID=A0A2P4PFN7_RHIID|nr:hypothetical protein GLOIN_2v1677785 [Rhizophagus irregularis DAOM 181602=DAOM 197198]POG64208.1 hypothetical protein GLOIN_2v1677785 [Rhizophagus irregularis DAOM 181602=DAOM 197198]GET53270.1 hypothetical protein GLOIN_2v1677785 [Rhizophagus irregularis DAOM 181602=DAOM 197198]|eukprot:XP_025171074.1 hypothetical protein GLOIN_2v1677785 [Rhizophagus irregularis DAOM 181602=DAOM 197198]